MVCPTRKGNHKTTKTTAQGEYTHVSILTLKTSLGHPIDFLLRRTNFSFETYLEDFYDR